MIEMVIGDGAAAEVRLSDDVAEAFAATRAAVREAGGLVWGEHCSECSYPRCYSSCAFYTPRADLHCRRFEAGFEPVAGAVGLHRVRFRKWGKLEAPGPVGLGAPCAETAADGALPLPYAVRRSRVRRLNERRQARSSSGRAPGEGDVFVLECASADGRTHPLTLTVLQIDGPGLFQAQAVAGPRHSRLTVPVAEIAARVPLDRPYLIQIEPVGEAEGRAIVFGLCDFARLDPAVSPAADAATPVKVVVWDLDETLWTGTLAEDGAGGVTPRPEAVALIQALDERGVLQSVASKNDEAEALAALRRFGLEAMFLHPQVGWGPKSDSLRRIAEALDLGLDSLVFIDDQPFERGEVAAALPAVRCVTHEAVAELIDHRWFRLPVTPESRMRRALYQAEAVRGRMRQAAGSDYLGFLRGCGIALDIRPVETADLERVFELSQRTNQLNFNGTKLSRDQAAGLIGGDRLALTVRCRDRFGDYGLIGLAIADAKGGVLEDFFMSCRVQRKRVEHALFAHLTGRFQAAGADAFRVRFTPTERNGAAARLLEELGFARAGDGGWSRPIDRPFPDADVATVGLTNLAEAA